MVPNPSLAITSEPDVKRLLESGVTVRDPNGLRKLRRAWSGLIVNFSRRPI